MERDKTWPCNFQKSATMSIADDACSLLDRYLRGWGRWDGVGCTGRGGGREDMIDTRGLSKVGFYLQVDIICKIVKQKSSDWIDLSCTFAVLKQGLCLFRPIFDCCSHCRFQQRETTTGCIHRLVLPLVQQKLEETGELPTKSLILTFQKQLVSGNSLDWFQHVMLKR